MSRSHSIILAALAVLTLLCAPLKAQEFNALARLNAEASWLEDTQEGLEITLQISQTVPWRVFVIDGPPRVVLDFSEVAWSGEPRNLSQKAGDLRVGSLRPGWSRMVVALEQPMVVDTAEMLRRPSDDAGLVRVLLAEATEEEFAAQAGVPSHAAFVAVPPKPVEAQREFDPNRLRVVLDPGHGGIDPGAQFAGLREVDLMMTMALQLKDVLTRTGRVDVVLTRENDVFVSLERRIALANEANGDLFISLHADSLAEGSPQARGATVYTLSDKASDAASQALAERHDRDNLLAGVDLSGQEDEIALVLMEIARRETAPRAQRFADRLVSAFSESDLKLAGRPRRAAGFSVLKSPDIPSVLLELGFLTNERDRENLTDPEWRERMASVIAQTVLEWSDDEAVRRALIRN